RVHALFFFQAEDGIRDFHVTEFRRVLFRSGTQEGYDNRPVMARILELRREKASLLGYQTFADFQTENRMAKSGANVKKFLNDLRSEERRVGKEERSRGGGGEHTRREKGARR